VFEQLLHLYSARRRIRGRSQSTQKLSLEAVLRNARPMTTPSMWLVYASTFAPLSRPDGMSNFNEYVGLLPIIEDYFRFARYGSQA
jgi:hypothetical protein